MDCREATRDGRPFVEFSWAGSDEGDQVTGRGWVALAEDGTLDGRILFHLGDDSGFPRGLGPEREDYPRTQIAHR
jgi:hypothetical protein